jgi:hypothetical protein
MHVAVPAPYAGNSTRTGSGRIPSGLPPCRAEQEDPAHPYDIVWLGLMSHRDEGDILVGVR